MKNVLRILIYPLLSYVNRNLDKMRTKWSFECLRILEEFFEHAYGLLSNERSKIGSSLKYQTNWNIFRRKSKRQCVYTMTQGGNSNSSVNRNTVWRSSVLRDP